MSEITFREALYFESLLICYKRGDLPIDALEEINASIPEIRAKIHEGGYEPHV